MKHSGIKLKNVRTVSKKIEVLLIQAHSSCTIVEALREVAHGPQLAGCRPVSESGGEQEMNSGLPKQKGKI